ncbi:hypothetical protein SAMN04489859_103318 [Paracoccus alcaliphilus]|uniref:Uncharacterized protein n=1 Tax=Paracoccus alcaliphilus TaxID=34002 RepID=A0A1H8LRG6_9RHOB|nr:hypothetical protein [Paracoccus alcaliphilus]WCR17234.1 hypothetical protein JHW40_12795 [Paracoccus alcaliphilus]SEO07689.1 hypothetical protein SAMN04489859_103318 [Paracoccus alcaliphilus]
MSQKLIRTDQVARLRAALTEAPPKPKTGYMVREIVAELAPALLEMRQKGYDLVDIAAYFGQQDIAVSASTLGSYLRDYEREKQFPKGKPRNARRKATPPQGKEVMQPDDNGDPGSDALLAAAASPAIRASQE